MQSIVWVSRNEFLFENYQQVVGELTEWRYRGYSDRGMLLRSAREHANVVRFLRNHDPSGARAAMNWHLHRLYDGLPKISGEPARLDRQRSGRRARMAQSPGRPIAIHSTRVVM